MKNKIIFFVPILLILLFWSDTLLHFSTRIHDWLDGTFIIWTMQNNIMHFKALAWNKIYETNAMYPFPLSLSFTDHLYIPSLFGTVISFFSSNPFLQFNIITVGNHILLYISFYILAKRFSDNPWVRTLSAFYFSFGPYFILQMGHLQMVFVWPLIISLYFLLDPEKKTKSFIYGGICLGVEFLTGTYLGIIGLTIICLFFSAEFIQKRFEIKKILLFFVSFFVIAGVSIYGYLLVNSRYHPVREQGQYVNYSAHITDYVFPAQQSVLYSFIGFWTNLNRHMSSERAAFIGFFPIILFVTWALNRKKKIPFLHKYKLPTVWISLMIGIGFIFSLGPRFNWNGAYLVKPLPYLILLKLFPPIGILRAVARWYFMVYLAVSIGIVYLLHFVYEIAPKNKKTLIMILFSLFVVLEFYQKPVQTIARDYKRLSDLFLQSQCDKDNGPILEYPFEYRAEDRTVEKYLAAKTNTLMYSTLHTCPMLSGFSSFEPPLFLTWEKSFDENGIGKEQMDILKQNKFKYIRINIPFLMRKEKTNLQSLFHVSGLTELYKDKESIIYEIK